MSSEMNLDIYIKLACLTAVVYLIYVFIKDRFGKK